MVIYKIRPEAYPSPMTVVESVHWTANPAPCSSQRNASWSESFKMLWRAQEHFYCLRARLIFTCSVTKPYRPQHRPENVRRQPNRCWNAAAGWIVRPVSGHCEVCEESAVPSLVPFNFVCKLLQKLQVKRSRTWDACLINVADGHKLCEVHIVDLFNKQSIRI